MTRYNYNSFILYKHQFTHVSQQRQVTYTTITFKQIKNTYIELIFLLLLYTYLTSKFIQLITTYTIHMHIQLIFNSLTNTHEYYANIQKYFFYTSIIACENIHKQED